MATLQLAIDATKAKDGAAKFAEGAKTVQNEANKAAQTVENLSDKLNKQGEKSGLVASQISELVRAYLGFEAVKKAIEVIGEFEQAELKFSRTSKLTKADQHSLTQEFIAMSAVAPTTVNQFLQIATVGGQLGIKTKAGVKEFSDAVAQFSEVAGMGAKESALLLGRTKQAAGESSESIKEYASTLVMLADSNLAAEGEIAGLNLEMSKVLSPFKIGTEKSAALSATLIGLGVDSGMASQGISKLFNSLDQATKQGENGKLSIIANVSGMKSEDFSKLFNSDAIAALQKFLQGINKLEDAGTNVKTVFKDLVDGDARMLKSLLPLIQNTDQLQANLDSLGSAWAKTGALEKRAADQANTIDGQWKIFGNTMRALVISQDGLGASIGKAMKTFNEALGIVVGFSQATGQTSTAVKVLVGVLDALAVVIGLIVAKKLADVFLDIFLHVINLSKTMNLFTSIIGSVLPVAVALGAVFLGWSIGEALFDQFKEVQLALESVRHAWATVANIGDSDAWKKTKAFFTGDTAQAPAKHKFQAMSEDDLHTETVSSINKNFHPTDRSFEDVLGDKVLENIRKVSAAMKEFSVSGVLSKEVVSDLNKAFEDATKATKKAGDATKDAGESFDADNVIIGSQLVALKKEADLLKYVGLARVQETAIIAAQNKAKLENLTLTDKGIAQLKEAIRLNALAKAHDEINQKLGDKRDQAQNLGLVGDDATKAAEEFAILNKYKRDGLVIDEETINTVKRTVGAVEDLKSKWDKVHAVSNGFATAFASSFEEVITHTKTLKDALIGLAQQLEKIALQALVTKPLEQGLSKAFSSILGGLSGAAGGAAGGAAAPVVAHASGDIFGSPTFFSSGGRQHVMGESGPEAVMPLQRGSDGKLGVRGGNTTNVTMNVYANDVNGFRASSRQIAANLKKSL